MPQYRLDQKAPHILTLIVMSSFASIGAVIFTPALPDIATYFKVSSNHSQLAITLFLVGYAIGQLIYGPLSNRFGRKRAFYIGVLVATIGSVVSILSEPLNSFFFLILGRMLEALGSSAGLVISFTVINDHYYPDQARRIIAYMMLSFAVAPGIATLIGGFLVTHFHWISCFYFLLLYGLLLAVPVGRMTETAKVLNRQALKVKHIHQSYSTVFKNKTLLYTALFFSLTSMCIYVYAASAPFIAIDDLHVSPQNYGILGLIPFLGTGTGALLSARLAGKLPAKMLIKTGLIIEVCAAVVLAVLFYLSVVNVIILIAAGFVFMLGGCLIISNAASLATATLEDKASASAVMNFINVGMPVCGTFVIALVPGTPIIKLPSIFLLALAGMFGLWQVVKRVNA